MLWNQQTGICILSIHFLVLKYNIDIYKKYSLCNKRNKHKLYNRMAQKQNMWTVKPEKVAPAPMFSGGSDTLPEINNVAN